MSVQGRRDKASTARAPHVEMLINTVGPRTSCAVQATTANDPYCVNPFLRNVWNRQSCDSEADQAAGWYGRGRDGRWHEGPCGAVAEFTTGSALWTCCPTVYLLNTHGPAHPPFCLW